MLSQLLLGIWLGTLSLPGAKLPFNFELVQRNDSILMIIQNAEERIICKEIIRNEDSLFIHLPVYNSEFRVEIKDDELSGNWYNNGRAGNPVIPFHAKHNVADRFVAVNNPVFSMEGRWEAWFDAGTPDSSKAVGIFKQDGNKVTGTFLSESGDHRYIEGIIDGDSLKLSVFDGSHCYLYLAKYSDDELKGVQYSGLHYKGNWKAKRNDEAYLLNPYTLTQAENPFTFSFPDVNGVQHTFPSPEYKGKVVVIEIMGTWCPNCLDETKFLSEYYLKNKHRGIEMTGLAFERFSDQKIVKENISRLMNEAHTAYPVLIAGMSGGKNVMKALPAVKNFISFPTTIFIGKNGKVKYVHAGFSGPATGKDYEHFQEEFDRKINLLLNSTEE